MRIGGKFAKYNLTWPDADTQELYHWAPTLEEKLRSLPDFIDVNSDLQITNPTVKCRSTATRPPPWA